MKNTCLYVLLFLFSVPLLAQTQLLDVKIDSITSEDVRPEKRSFKIHYHIENRTGQPISFFLHPNGLIPNATSSMTLSPIYKLYQNGSFIPLDGPLYEHAENQDWRKYAEMKEKNTAEAKEFLKEIAAQSEARAKAIVDNYRKNGGKSGDELWIIKNQQLLESKITLNPKEIRQFSIKTDWNKQRYFKEDDLEYYLDEKDTFEIELTLHLIKTYFKERLSPEEFGKIYKDLNFIEGIYTSNKAVLNFGS